MKSSVFVCLVANYVVFAACMFSDGSYKAAVVEYSPIKEPFHQPDEILKWNSEEYIKFIKKAAEQGAEIIIFPEDGLTTVEVASKKKEQLKGFAIEVHNPQLKPNPCNNESLHKVLRLLSCEAKENRIYVVVNLLEWQRENNEDVYYNTDVVFDRDGTIIKRYRKINLFYEPNFKRGNEIVTFTTDFGVTFGIFTCFDIFFKRPALEVIRQQNVTDIIYAAAWFSETPYLQALTVQAGYARATGVNLLAAGLNDPENKNGGSGIYLYDGRVAELYISPAKSSRLIVQEVPKINIRISAVKCNNNSHVMPRFRLGGNLNVGSFSTFTENMTLHTTRPLNTNTLETKAMLCNFNGGYCCNFHVVLEEPMKTTDLKYRLALFYGIRTIADSTAGIRSCGLVACLNDDVNSCGKRKIHTRSSVKFANISITGTFAKNSEVYDQPATLTYDLIPVTEYTYCETLSDDKSRVEAKMVTTQTLSNLLTFGIHGRLFDYDGQPAGLITNSANSLVKYWGLYVVCLLVAYRW